MAPILTTACTALLMMVHAVVGCCWHHGHPLHFHANHEFDQSPAIHRGDAAGHEHAAHEHADEESLASHVGCDDALDHRHCDEASCSYLRPNRAANEVVAVSGMANWNVSQRDRSLPAFGGPRAPEDLRDEASAPLHARLSVWLL